VFATQNSPRARQSAQRKRFVRQWLLATAPPSRRPLLPGYPSPTPEFLIANLELEFHASCCKQRSELLSNRKFSAVLPPERILDPALPRDPGTVLVVPLFSSSLETPASSLQNPWPPSGGRLIVTPRLEFPATATKQNSNAVPNRYKTPFFAPLSRSSPITRRSSRPCPGKAQDRRRVTVAPISRKAIMGRNQFTQIPRSQPLLRKVTNADANQS
jgi:hypothetical protein